MTESFCEFTHHNCTKFLLFFLDFVVAKLTPTIEANLRYKFFFMFAAINIGGMFIFALFIPETKGKSLEEVRLILHDGKKKTILMVHPLDGHSLWCCH